MAAVPEHVERDQVLELMRREVSPDEHEEIRELWKKHSKAEDDRDLPGLISTLTPDCVYEVRPDGARWEGHDGATRFYMELLGAFPDIHFDLTDIVIGPQGVFEVATMTGTHLGPWNGIAPTGRPFRTTVLIFFPWDRAAGKFAGEKIYIDVGRLVSGG